MAFSCYRHGGGMVRFFKKIFGGTPPSIACFGRTDTGRVRSNNEDNFATLVEKKLFIVADGMGGHQAGEVASQTAVECLIDFFTADKLREIKGNPAAIQYTLIYAFIKTNDKVMEIAAKNPDLAGMGSTLVACLVNEGFAYICHVGDVRAYLDDGYILQQLTTDHSLVAGLPGAASSGGKNIITRCIGFPFAEDPEFHRVELASGNKILLCSDGLWNMTSDEEMHRILGNADSPEEACDNLVSKANDAGGRDNITAVVLYC